MMPRTFVLVCALFLLLLNGCGSSGGTPPTFLTQVLSSSSLDGDISKDPVTGLYTVTQGGVQSLFAGIDPVTGTESRAFLHFPLSAAGLVPANVTIVSAQLDLFINSITPQPLIGTIPVRVDLVAFQPPTLIGSDFDLALQPALASVTITPPISQSDLGRHVFVDVTTLLFKAQQLGLTDIQFRVMEGLGIVTPGMLELNDTTGASRPVLAPLLEIVYF